MGYKIVMIEKLYEKYLIECSNNSILEAVAFELFKEKICDKLSDMNSIAIDNGVDEQGVLYYSLWSNDGIQTCNVPVYGYYASSEKTLSKLFCKLSDTVISNGDTKFQINLYAHDYEALALFSMMQFGYIYEQGRLEITDYPYQFNDTYTIKTLEKDEIEKRWDEIWSNRQIIPRENCRYLSRYLDIYKKGSEVSGQTVPLSLFV